MMRSLLDLPCAPLGVPVVRSWTPFMVTILIVISFGTCAVVYETVTDHFLSAGSIGCLVVLGVGLLFSMCLIPGFWYEPISRHSYQQQNVTGSSPGRPSCILCLSPNVTNCCDHEPQGVSNNIEHSIHHDPHKSLLKISVPDKQPQTLSTVDREEVQCEIVHVPEEHLINISSNNDEEDNKAQYEHKSNIAAASSEQNDPTINGPYENQVAVLTIESQVDNVQRHPARFETSPDEGQKFNTKENIRGQGDMENETHQEGPLVKYSASYGNFCQTQDSTFAAIAL